MKKLHNLKYCSLILFFYCNCFSQSITIEKKMQLKLFDNNYNLGTIQTLIKQSLENTLIKNLIESANNNPYGNYDIQKISTEFSYYENNVNQMNFITRYQVNDLLFQKLFDDCNAKVERNTKITINNKDLVLIATNIDTIYIDFSDYCLVKKTNKQKLIDDFNTKNNCNETIKKLNQVINENFEQLSKPLNEIKKNNNQFIELNLDKYTIDNISINDDNIEVSINYTITLK